MQQIQNSQTYYQFVLSLIDFSFWVNEKHYNNMKKLQLTFNKKYTSSTRIGIGNGSEVYLGFELDSERQVSIKIESVNNPDGMLEREAKFYRIVKGGEGIPNLYWYGIEHNNRVLISDVYGPSLQQLLTFCNGTFSLKTTLLITNQILHRIEWVHSKGLIYNDIEPENFLVGLQQQQDKIFMVDFGSCRKYLDGQGNHVKYDTTESKVVANLRFKSVASHIGRKAGRKDDLESLGYMLVYFMKGMLPWDQLLKIEGNKDLEIKERKTSVPVELLTADLPQQFGSFFNYIHTLEYEEEPDYSWMRRLFQDLFDRQGYVNNRVMDWAEKHKY